MSESLQGTLKVSLKDDKGVTLTKEHGFSIEEENGDILSFDYIENEEHGSVLLFGNQIFFLKFWRDEDLQKAQDVLSKAFARELERRQSNERED